VCAFCRPLALGRGIDLESLSVEGGRLVGSDLLDDELLDNTLLLLVEVVLSGEACVSSSACLNEGPGALS
jgi:hypothetical protein